MNEIQQMITFLQVLIAAGAVARIAYCLVVMAMDGEEEKSYRTRIRNVLIFLVFSECISGIVKSILSYF